jgi:FK506-binding protein 4/5
MCHLKREEWIEARNVCDKVIAENPNSDKAYFRRGEAMMMLNDHFPAKDDFAKCVELDGANAAAKKRLAQCMALIKTQKAKEKKTFANMFDKFAEADTKREELAK